MIGNCSVSCGSGRPPVLKNILNIQCIHVIPASVKVRIRERFPKKLKIRK